MTSRLRAEDQPDFDQVLRQALESAEIRAALGARTPGAADRLRHLAYARAAAMAVAAAPEYEEYVRLRGTRSPSPAAGAGDGGGSGGGVRALVAVLTPLLSAVAALIFLTLGYGLLLVGADKPLQQALVTVGWTAAAVAGASTAAGLAGMLVTAARNRSAPPQEADEVARARDAWRRALLERGVLPFLRNHLGREPQAPAGRADRPSRLGFTSPDFESPDFGSPDFDSPAFDSPDFTGSREHETGRT